MAHYKYLIVGGGMTADAAVQGIREVDPDGAIGLVSAEPDPPYNRPPLSKGLWKGDPLAGIWRGTDARGVELLLGRRVIGIDVRAKRARDNGGAEHTFDRLLLATGGRARRLPLETEQIIYFRTLEDYRRLRAIAEHPVRFVVLGGGFIGTEIAAALRLVGREVTMLVPEDGLGARVFPADLSRFLVGFYRDKGVDVRAAEGLAGLTARRGAVLATTTGGAEVTAEIVVGGIGIQPNVELAEQAGLRVENGVLVDERLATTHPDVYAAGDVANFFNPTLGARLRVEHEDNANAMGRVAGRNMAGAAEPYHHLPFFYSDLFELGYEAVGELDPRLETVADWKEPFREGVVYYLKDGRVRGVLLWNTWGQVDAARALIAQSGPFKPGQLRGRLPA